MTDASWDNQGMGAPPRSGMPTWLKVLMGCGVVMVLGLGACVGGVAWLNHRVKQDPEGFKQKALGFAITQIRPDYEFAARTLQQLKDEAGCRALYAANPSLHQDYPTEQAFLDAAAGWRPHLEDLPPLTTDLLEQHGLELNKEPFGGVHFGYRMKDGSRVRMDWSTGDRRLTRLELQPGRGKADADEAKP